MAGKKDPATPKKPRFAWVSQLRLTLQQARVVDPHIVLWMAVVFGATWGAFVGIGFAVGHPIYLGAVGLPVALLVALIVMARRTERAAYQKLEGQPGGAGAALGGLRRGWYHEQQPVAAEANRSGDMSSAALVFRAVGRPGVVLIAEGPRARARKLAEGERKRVARFLTNVPVTVLHAGSGEDEVPVRKIVGKLNRMRPTLTKAEASAVNKRLTALGSGKLPIPQGIDPTRARPDRKGMRGK
ncbi:MAG: DUF4191 domain-containing protein [Angustibacter sp.]